MRGFLHSLASSIAAMGGIAGFNGDASRFVPIAGSRNSIRYPEPNRIGGRQQKRFARQLAAGKLSFFDHDANRRMIADRALIAKVRGQLFGMSGTMIVDDPIAEIAIRKLNKELDAPLPEITIGDYVEDGVSVVAFIEDRDTTLAPEIAEKIERTEPGVPVIVTPDDLAKLRSWLMPKAVVSFRAGAARDHLRDAGLIAYEKATRSWIVTDAGHAALNKG